MGRRTTQECKDCGATFFTDDADVETYSSDEHDHDLACPECGSVKLKDGGYCKMCGAPLRAGVYLCDDCKEILNEYMCDMFRDMQRQRLNEQKEHLLWTAFVDGLEEYVEILVNERDEFIEQIIKQCR